MKSKKTTPFLIVVLLLLIVVIVFYISDTKGRDKEADQESITFSNKEMNNDYFKGPVNLSRDQKHSIPFDEILSGGPAKDGIPAINFPKFVKAESASWVKDIDIGIGLEIEGESRFYPFTILVWHELVNDEIQGQPILVSYCPLCATAIVFDRRVDEEDFEFGVSGMLWQSNLLMYNRVQDKEKESLWSQVLGEAVVGEFTGKKLRIIQSDVVSFEDWLKGHPDTIVLSQDTGIARSYGSDPYEDYYESREVSFGASFSDDRLHPKEFVLGIEINNMYKAYALTDMPNETSVTDTFQEKELLISKNKFGEVGITSSAERIPYIGGFWFSWIAVHSDSDLYIYNQ